MTNLKRIRLEKQIKAAEVAKKLKVTRQSVCIAEKKGIRNACAARRYAEILGCDWRDLFDDIPTHACAGEQ